MTSNPQEIVPSKVVMPRRRQVRTNVNVRTHTKVALKLVKLALTAGENVPPYSIKQYNNLTSRK